MCLISFVLFFQVNYKCNFGQAVYLSGNIDILGNWNPARAPKLDWTEGHNWCRKLKVMHDNTKLIEYKYFVASAEPGKPLDNIQWEFGPNRYVDLFTSSKLFVRLKDDWEFVKVKLAIHNEAVKKYLTDEKHVVAYTNIGHEKSSHEMKLKKQMLKGSTNEDYFWTVSLRIPIYTAGFNYKFKICGKSRDEVEADRGHRKFVLKKFPHSASFNELYMVKCSTLVKYDFSFSTSLSYDVVTDDILVGAYPQTIKDVEELSNLGVKAVLNLQTFSDMTRFNIDWEFLQNCYTHANITCGHFPIPDMDFEELRLKIKDAASQLDELLKRGKVYVHCTAGRHRSPHVIIFYLNFYRNYDLKHAVSLVKSKRAHVKVLESVFPDSPINQAFIN